MKKVSLNFLMGTPRGANRVRYHSRMIQLLIIYGTLSLLVLPVATFWLGSHGDPLKISFSAIGNRPGMRTFFLLWTAGMGLYTVGAVTALLVLTASRSTRPLRVMVLAGVTILMIGNCIPFMPDRFPRLSHLHLDGAIGSALILSLTLSVLVFSFRRSYPILFRKASVTLFLLLTATVSLFIVFRMKWITEVTLILGTSIFLFLLLLWLYQEEDFNEEDVLSTYDIGEAEQTVKKLKLDAKHAQEVYQALNTKVRIARMELAEMKSKKKQSGS